MKKTYFLLLLLATVLGAFAQGVKTKGFAVMLPSFDFSDIRVYPSCLHGQRDTA